MLLALNWVLLQVCRQELLRDLLQAVDRDDSGVPAQLAGVPELLWRHGVASRVGGDADHILRPERRPPGQSLAGNLCPRLLAIPDARKVVRDLRDWRPRPCRRARVQGLANKKLIGTRAGQVVVGMLPVQELEVIVLPDHGRPLGVMLRFAPHSPLDLLLLLVRPLDHPR